MQAFHGLNTKGIVCAMVHTIFLQESIEDEKSAVSQIEAYYINLKEENLTLKNI